MEILTFSRERLSSGLLDLLFPNARYNRVAGVDHPRGSEVFKDVDGAIHGLQHKAGSI